ncbi:MAG: T9SS type A sorting domain-containing protein, partial [Bacteroidota bacterium]
SDNLFFETSISDLGKIEIVNVEGKKIMEESHSTRPSTSSLNIQSLSQGVYELNFYSKNGLLIGKKRFVKI